MAYDRPRGLTVLYGGYDGVANGETWELGRIPGDLNCDCVVDLADLGILLADFGCTP
jgi:hypothetical protein